jgi:ABC-type amino acid transport substrate-binding protein
MKKQNLVSIFTIACILSVVITSSAFSQVPVPEENLPRIESLGVRDIVSPIKEFCKVFHEELSEHLGSQIRYIPLENEYRGKRFSRFQGLLDRLVDAECGPNSISAQNLVNPNSTTNERYSEKVAFSNPFYETEIRLLLRSELAAQLAGLTGDELTEKLKELKIGLLENTTTIRQFQDLSQMYTLIPFETKYDDSSDNSLIGKNALEQALDALEAGEIEALASDGIILRSFLKEGIPEDNIDKPNTILFRKPRVPYESLGFSIFPKQGALPGLDVEQYGIAILKGDRTDSFRRDINIVLSDLERPGSNLEKAKERIKDYEFGLMQAVDPQPVPDEESSPVNILLIIAGCFFALAVLIALKFQDYFRGQLSGPMGSLTVEGRNDRSRDSGIKIVDATSRQGGIKADENTGRGIDARNVDAQNDITFSSSNPSNRVSQLNDNLINSGREEIGVDLNDIVAGRDVTVQQVFQDIGVTHFNAGKNADNYIRLWESILSLKIALDDFFEAPSADNLSHLALQLKETRDITHKCGIFFKDSDKIMLFTTLQDMGDVRVGRKFLKEIRSTDSVKEVTSSGIIIPSSRGIADAIFVVAERLEAFKLDYESTIERLRPFFKEKLSL